MNLKKEIFERISAIEKVELSETKKVELALIDDIKSYTVGLKKYTDEGDGLKKLGERQQKEFLDTISAIRKWSDLGNSMANDMANYLVNFERQAKDLGIDPKNSKEYVEGDKAFKAYSEYAQAMTRLADKLKKI
jgi:hypothetical protein